MRFIRVSQQIYAIKETREPIALQEYRLLRDLRELRIPAVEPIGVVTGRQAPSGAEIEPVLVTRHLEPRCPIARSSPAASDPTRCPCLSMRLSCC